MRLRAGDIFTAARAEVDDFEGDIWPDENLVTLLNNAQRDLLNDLFKNPNIGRYKTSVVLANVPAGTKSLKDYFADGGALELLEELVMLRERPAGADDIQFSPMTNTNNLPPSQQVNRNGQYTFTGDDILLPGAQQATDIKAYGAFKPREVKTAEDPILPGADSVLTYMLAVKMSRIHGNKILTEELKFDREREYQNLFNNMIMEQQMEQSRQLPFGGEASAQNL